MKKLEILVKEATIEILTRVAMFNENKPIKTIACRARANIVILEVI